MKTISKSETAKRFGLTPAMITRYVRLGMPVTSTGRINWAAAQKWRKDNINPSLSGSFRHRQNEATSKPAKLQSPKSGVMAAYRLLLDRILGHRQLVPGILAECGVRDPVVVHSADDIFASLVLAFTGELGDLAYDWEGDDDIPPVEADIQAVFEKHGLKLTREVAAAADRMADLAAEVTEKVMEEARQ